MMRIFILVFSLCSCQAVTDKIAENCQRPALENGYMIPDKETYKHNDKVPYGCNKGLKPALETWWGEITCINGAWSHQPQCIDLTWCTKPLIPHSVGLQEAYSPGEHTFTCAFGYKVEIRNSDGLCEDGLWTRLPECKRERTFCEPPPRVEYAMITTPYKDLFENGEKLEYVCGKGYRLRGKKESVCDKGEWNTQPKCDKIKCHGPTVKNGRPTEYLKSSYDYGETVEFRCDYGYSFVGKNYAICEDEWNLPVCKDPTSCTTPHVPNTKLRRLQEVYKSSHHVSFACNDGYRFRGGRNYALCYDGSWTLPECLKLCDVPHVPNARILTGSDRYYETGDYATFQCDRGYHFEGLQYTYCENGNWKLPVCLPEGDGVCTPPQVPNAQPVYMLTSFYASGRTVKFLCNIGFEFEGTDSAVCVNGRWRLPVCERIENEDRAPGPYPNIKYLSVSVCGDKPLIGDGDVIELSGGKELKVQCKRFYKLQGPDRVRCVDGKWTTLPVCKPPCVLDRTRIHADYSEDYLLEGEEKSIRCAGAWVRDTIVTCTNGVATYSECSVWNR